MVGLRLDDAHRGDGRSRVHRLTRGRCARSRAAMRSPCSTTSAAASRDNVARERPRSSRAASPTTRRSTGSSPRGRFDYVYHLAAYAAEGLSHFIKRFNYTNNVIGSVNLINAAVNTGVKGFVFTSSIAVYGQSPLVPMTEDTVPRARKIPTASPNTRSSRSCREPHHVRPRLHHLPAAQRLRPAPEHRRPLSQRRRHLHEPDPARPADDDLRRRHADARVQLHRRRRAGHGGGDRRAPRVEPGVQRRRRSAVPAERARRARRRSDGRRAAHHAPARRDRKCTTRTRPTRRFGACSAPRDTTRSTTGCGRWPHGSGAGRALERAVHGTSK